MNAKMDAKTFTYNDLKLIKIAKEDIWNAMRKLAAQKTKIQDSFYKQQDFYTQKLTLKKHLSKDLLY